MGDNFMKVETAKKTQEQIDRENAERDKNIRSKKIRRVIALVLLAFGLAAAIYVLKEVISA